MLQDLANTITLDVKTKREDARLHSTPDSKREKEEPVYNHIITDIWFKIAEHIDPEDTLNFALICRQTAFVVSSAKFWCKLYRRFYVKNKSLPDNLEPYCLNQVGAIRSKVIRALFYMHDPFVARIKNGYDLSMVHGLKYIDCWHKKEANIWLLYYKLWNCLVPRRSKEYLGESDESEDEDGLSKALCKLNNVFENPHEGMYLLIICSRRFIPFPALNGNDVTLRSTRQPIGSDLKSTNLEIKFTHSHMSSLSVEVVYPAVIKHKVIPWWHPEYRIFLTSTTPQID